MTEQLVSSIGSKLLIVGLVLFGVCAACAMLYYLVYVLHSLINRKTRRRELAHHVFMILDPNGCSDAIERYKECGRLCHRYFLKLSEVGFQKDEIKLFDEAMASFRRYEERAARYKT